MLLLFRIGSTDKSKRQGTFGRDINHRVGD